jgi:hypothetical protein
MKSPNILKRLLQELGIKSMVPTEELLKEMGDMTLVRFNKILENSSPKELTALEAQYLTRWLARLTNQPAASISLVKREEVPAI